MVEVLYCGYGATQLFFCFSSGALFSESSADPDRSLREHMSFEGFKGLFLFRVFGLGALGYRVLGFRVCDIMKYSLWSPPQ